MSLPAVTSRHKHLQTIAGVAVAVLVAKVWVSILHEYPSYFPPDFDSAFLTGRRESFTALYATAFYAHLISGPLTIVLGAFLLWSGGRAMWLPLHRWAGRVQIALVLVVLVPSGLAMARNAFAGPIAGAGFASLSLATGASAAATLYFARTRRYARHMNWARRCAVLLFSPLLLRVVSGALIVTQWESPAAYCANAWLSWLVPLVLFEVWLRSAAGAKSRSSVRQQPIPQTEVLS